jgi:hypothetical protein
MLNGAQQLDQRRAAQARRDPDNHHQHPETRTVARHDPTARDVGLSRTTSDHGLSLTATAEVQHRTPRTRAAVTALTRRAR